MKQPVPLVCELVTYADESDERLFVRDCGSSSRARHAVLLGSACDPVEQAAAVARGVCDAQDEVGDGFEVEGVAFLWQVDLPAGDGAHVLEGQVALVPEVKFKHPTVV